MISFFIGRARIRVQPLFLVLCLLCQLSGGMVLPALCALFLHEAGHLLCARLLRLPLLQLDITPFGGVLRFSGTDELPGAKRFFLYASGALANLFGLLSALLLYRLGLPHALCAPFVRASCLLLAFNLLPALPLDGGRMLLALLCGPLDEKRVSRALLLAARLLGGALCGLALAGAVKGQFSVFPMSAGLYLIALAAMEQKGLPALYAHYLIERRLLLEKRGVIEARALAVLETERLTALFPRLCDAKYHTIHVISADGQLLHTLDEQKICSALFDNAEQTIGEVIT